MKSFFKGGSARRSRESARRGNKVFLPSIAERLESRRLMAAGALGINVEIGAYESLVNWLQVPATWMTSPGQSNPITLNASGDPSSDSTLLFDYRVNQSYNGPDPNAVAPNLIGTYHLSFNGQATIGVEYPGFSTPFTVANQVYTASTNTTTADLIVPSTNTSDFFGITFSNTIATPNGATNTGFSQAKLIRPGYAAGSTQLYTNEFLAALKPYGTLRYLDPEQTNGQPFFNGNTLVTVNASQVDQTGMPWEYLVTLANQTNTDMWINVPEGATDDYVQAMAGIIKNGGTVDGVTYAGLNSNLKVYVEYSNEVWGGIAFNEYYQEAAVQNSASNQPLSTFPGNQYVYTNADGSTTDDYNVAVGRRYLERTAEIGQIFQNVMGSDPTHQRIRPVLGWQENQPSFYVSALNWYETFFGSASSAFYGIGNADYWSPTDYSSVDAAINSLQAQETSYAISNTTAYTALATYYGLANVSYEGGPSISGDPSTPAGQVALAVTRDPRMEQLVAQHYFNYFADGGTLANYYSGPYGFISPENQWPIAEDAQYGNPGSSPRYEGTVDVANAAPVAVTAGIHVSSSSPTTFVASTDSIGTDFSNPIATAQAFWLLNVATSGTYDLSLSSVSGAGTPAGLFKIFINGHEYGGLFTQGATNSLDLGNVSLPAGIVTLSMLETKQGLQFQPTTFTLTPSSHFGLGDTGFETVVEGSGQFAYDPLGSPWAFSGMSGISANASGFTGGNPVAPQGSQVAFLQEKGSFSETVSGWTAGTYVLSLVAAQRANYGTSAEDFEIMIDGVIIAKFKPSGTAYQNETTPTFSVSSGTHTIMFVGLDTVGGDNTVFLDNISMSAGSNPIPSPNPSAPTVGDSSFETISEGSGFSYNPSGSSWTFSGGPGSGSGVSGNNSAFTSGNPAAPQGQQVAFLQSQGTITQSITGWTAGTYTIGFSAAQRGNYGTSREDFQILVDGVVVGIFKPGGTIYQSFTTSSFSVGSGSHTIAFVGLDSAGGDNTVFLDNVTVSVSLTQTIPTVRDSGFETVSEVSGFAYNPSGSYWTFSGGPGSGSGVSGNNSAFTSGNSAAPQGQQVAFLQSQGTITQSITGWTAGTYTIGFSAAQRGNYGISSEDFQVLVDGVVVGIFKPGGTIYQSFTTSSFSVGSGSHTIAFVGLDSAGSDNTVFLDNVTLTSS